MHSVVIIKLATDDASNNAVFTTLVGSTMPYFFKSTYLPVAALKPMASLFSYNSFAELVIYYRQ
jgi:hypothetical protein